MWYQKEDDTNQEWLIMNTHLSVLPPPWFVDSSCVSRLFLLHGCRIGLPQRKQWRYTGTSSLIVSLASLLSPPEERDILQGRRLGTQKWKDPSLLLTPLDNWCKSCCCIFIGIGTNYTSYESTTSHGTNLEISLKILLPQLQLQQEQ